MDNQSQPIDPKAGLMVISDQSLSNTASESIDLLYQPIVGVAATALVRLLWQFQGSIDHPYPQIPHHQLFTMLQMDARQFYEARIKLEGAGLLRTFIQPTDGKPVFLYRLVAPLEYRAFFNDDLLSLALLENLGEKGYLALANRLLKRPFDFSSAKEVTQNFLDSFQIDDDQLAKQPATIEKLKADYELTPANSNSGTQPSSPANPPLELAADQTGFDFQMLLDTLASSYVSQAAVKKYYQLIINEHQMYGIDEVTMSKMIIRATNVQNNVFDPSKLKILISRYCQPAQPKPRVDQPAETSDQAGLSKAEQGLIQSVEQNAPAAFLDKLKAQRGGFATKEERKMVAELVEERVMDTGAVNMLVYHLIVDQERPSLARGLFNYVANDWVQKYHVKTAVDALMAIKQRNQTVANGGQARSYSSRNYRAPVKQAEPAWMKEGYQPQNDEPVSEARKQALRDRISRLNQD